MLGTGGATSVAHNAAIRTAESELSRFIVTSQRQTSVRPTIEYPQKLIYRIVGS